MEHIQVDVEREEAPEWAGNGANQTSNPSPATQRQLDFIRDLTTQKDLVSLSPEQRAALIQPDEFWQTGTTRLTKAKATRVIESLLSLPRRAREGYEPTTHMAERLAVGVPAGRYAVEGNDGLLKFYKIWVSQDVTRLSVYVEHGPDDSELKYHKIQVAVLNKIKAAGIRQCAIRYGLEIGACSNCGRRLTNHISRELGIGPICGARMFGDDFKVDVKIKRAELKAQGINPDQEVLDA